MVMTHAKKRRWWIIGSENGTRRAFFPVIGNWPGFTAVEQHAEYASHIDTKLDGESKGAGFPKLESEVLQT